MQINSTRRRKNGIDDVSRNWSNDNRRHRVPDCGLQAEHMVGLGCILLSPVSLIFLILHWSDAKNPFFLQLVGVGIDRKSTRLNSSHVRISYAVFCLKKKKKNNRE